MTAQSPRQPDPTRWGVQTDYVDAIGVRRRSSTAAIDAAIHAMRAETPAPPVERVRVGVRKPGAAAPRCHLPDRAPDWGWTAQLYALRSVRSWGMGDLADLRALSRWSRGLGAGMLLINPLHAVRTGLPQDPSPYHPSSRLFRNPLYLRIEDVPGARDDRHVQELSRDAHALNHTPHIDRDRVHALKMRALERLWRRFPGTAAFESYCRREGETLHRYAVFCVLSETHPGPWSAWPRDLRRPDSAAVTQYARQHRRRVDFHRWLQWLLDLQLLSASRGLTVVHDVAIGFAADGFDAWLWQDVLAPGISVGAPPDEYNLSGQDWGIPPFDPHRLRAAGFRPLIETLRRVMRPGGGVRIDHVMGLFRLWWVPAGAEPRDGVYVRYPAREMLDVLALESARNTCYVIGEDLGTVERGVRATLHHRRVLSYRIAWFEPVPPRRYAKQALAALTTHDLPTVVGLLTGEDIADMERYGIAVNCEAEERARRRLLRLAGSDGASPQAVVEAAYAALAEAPSMLVAASLDDVTLAALRPNLPGSMTRPNWSIPLPRTLEQLRRDALPRRVAAHLRARR